MEPTGVRAYNTWHSSTDASKLVHQKDLENSLVGRYQFQSEKGHVETLPISSIATSNCASSTSGVLVTEHLLGKLSSKNA